MHKEESVDVLFKSPSRGERLAQCLVFAVAAFGFVLVFVMFALFAQSQVEDWNRQLLKSVAPISMDAPH